MARYGNYAYRIQAAQGTNLVGFDTTGSVGSLRVIAKQNDGAPTALYMTKAGNPLNPGHVVAHLHQAKKLGSADELVVTFDGYDVNVAGATPTTSFGKPIRLKWNSNNEWYDTFTIDPVGRADLLTWFEAEVTAGRPIYASITQYTV